MTATTPSVTHTGRNREDTGESLDVRGEFWEASVWVSDGLWPTIELRRFIHTSGGETPTAKERGQIRRAAEKWVKNRNPGG
jgi:hypothetical protein